MFSKLCLPSDVLGLMIPGSRHWEGDGRCRGQRGERAVLEAPESSWGWCPQRASKPAEQPTWVLGCDSCLFSAPKLPPILDAHVSESWGFRTQNVVSPQKASGVGWFSAWVTEKVGSQPGSRLVGSQPGSNLSHQLDKVVAVWGPGPRPYHNSTPPAQQASLQGSGLQTVRIGVPSAPPGTLT